MLVISRKDTETSPTGTFDGTGNISNRGERSNQLQLLQEDENVRKKKHTKNRYDRRGRQDPLSLHQMRHNY